MASIHKSATVDVRPDDAWSAIRDVGAIHLRLAKGFVTETQLDGEWRQVTFASGATVRERIVAVDDHGRRLAYTVVGGQVSHHHASIQVLPEGDRHSRIVWITDLLPDDLAGRFDGMMELGMAAMKATLEGAHPG